MLSVQQAIGLPLLHQLVIICVVSHCHWAEPLRGEPTSHYRDSLIHDAVSDGPEGINKRHTTPFLNDWWVNEEWAESLDKFGYQIAASKKKDQFPTLFHKRRKAAHIYRLFQKQTFKFQTFLSNYSHSQTLLLSLLFSRQCLLSSAQSWRAVETGLTRNLHTIKSDDKLS